MKAGRIIPGFRYFESQEEDEKVVLFLRKHWLVLAEPLFLGGAVLVVLVIMILAVNFSEDVPFISQFGASLVSLFLSALILVTIVGSYIGWLVRYLHVVILTDEHLVEIEQPGIFNRQVSQLDLDTIEDASSSVRGILATVFKIGSVVIQTAGSKQHFEFRGLADPFGVQHKIMETKEMYMKVSTTFKPSPGEAAKTPPQIGENKISNDEPETSGTEN